MDCIFCKIVENAIPCRKIAETSRTLSFLDAFPLTAGHTLVIPKVHYTRLQEMQPEDAADLFETVRQVVARVDKLTGATLLAVHNGRGSGQEIPHVHVHLVPRSSDDGAGAIHSMFKRTRHLSEADMDKIHQSLCG